MKKNINIFCVLVLLLLFGFVIIKSDYIVAFAKSLYAYDYKYNEVYEKGDEIILHTNNNYSVPYVFVGYLDVDGNLLDFHNVESFQDLNYNYLEKFNVGESCVDTVKSFVGKEYDTNSYYQSYCNNTGEYSVNYYEHSDKLSEIKYWKLIDNTNKNIRDYCYMYDLPGGLCQYILQYHTSSYVSYQVYPVFMFQEYVVPKFTFNCDKDVLVYGETAVCTLNVNTNDSIIQMETNLEHEHFLIKDIKGLNGWNIEKGNDGRYILKNESGILGSKDVLQIQLEAEKNIKISSVINLTKFSFKTDGGFSATTDLKSNLSIKSNKDLSNPNTSDFNISILLFLLVILFVNFIKCNKKKRKFE